MTGKEQVQQRKPEFAQPAFAKLFDAAKTMDRDNGSQLSVGWAMCGIEGNAAHSSEFRFLSSARRTHKLTDYVASKLDDHFPGTEVCLGALEELFERQLVGPLSEMNDLGHRVVAHAIRIFRVLNRIGRVIHAFKHVAFA